MLVAIHQPNFIPWLGYFNKIAQADCFIVLDSVPAMRGGSNYYNRVSLLVNGAPHWVTMPLEHGESRARLDKARIAGSGTWRRKMLRMIDESYGRAAFHAETMEMVRRWLTQETDNLCSFNMTIIREVTALLGLDGTRIVRASELDVGGAATKLLIGLVKAVGGDSYLVGGGAGGYQQDELFEAAAIRVVPQGYRPTAYRQVNAREFVPGLSVVDALMNCGAAGTAMLVRGQPCPAC